MRSAVLLAGVSAVAGQSVAQAVLWSDCATPSATCKRFTGTDGASAEFDVASLLSAGGHTLNDTRAYPSFEYVFNVGASLDGTPNGICDSTADDVADAGVTCANQKTGAVVACPQNTNTYKSAGYQVWSTSDGNHCHRLTGDISATPSLVTWGLVDTDGRDPSMGVTLTMTGGDHTLVAYDPNTPNVRAAYQRTLRLVLRCSADDSPLPTSEEVRETQQGLYEITLETVHGCPTGCPRTGPTNERLCADHGSCQLWGVDGSTTSKMPKCICDKNFYGLACAESCTVSDCGGHGVCGYDADQKFAHCFCNSGYNGVDCTKAGTGGAVFVEAPPVQHQLASPDLAYPPVPGNSSSEEAYLYCYTLCASDPACGCFSLSFVELSLFTAQSDASCRFGTSAACSQTAACPTNTLGWPHCSKYDRPGVVDNSAAIAAAQKQAVATGAVVITMLVLLLLMVRPSHLLLVLFCFFVLFPFISSPFRDRSVLRTFAPSARCRSARGRRGADPRTRALLRRGARPRPNPFPSWRTLSSRVLISFLLHSSFSVRSSILLFFLGRRLLRDRRRWSHLRRPQAADADLGRRVVRRVRR